MDIHVYKPDIGIIGNVSPNQVDDRAATDGTKNVDFDNGVIFPAPGFEKIGGLNELDSGEHVTGIFLYNEVEGNQDYIVTTETSTFYYDRNNEAWTEISGATIAANLRYPVSFASILHEDALATKYQHLIICDGGKSAIKKWSGIRATATNLADGDGYNNSSTDHKALQVMSAQNRLLLISPYEEDSSGVWQPNLSRIRWPEQARLEDSAISGSAWNTANQGAGFTNLWETGDINVRGELINYVPVIYQTHSMWQLRYVGGNDVFTPDILYPNLGLLSYYLLVSTGSTHFFVGNDYSIYAYNGQLTNIGEPIEDLFKADLRTTHKDLCYMALGAQKRYLWIFIVTGSNDYATIAYKYNLNTGSWTVRDVSEMFNGSGVTSARLIGAGVYQIGQSYRDAVTVGTTYAEAAAGTEITTAETETGTAFSATGTVMTNASATWQTTGYYVSAGDIVKILSGTGATTGWYAIQAVATSGTQMTLFRSIGSATSGVDYDIYADDGDSYRDTFSEIQVDETLSIGTSDGHVLQENETLTIDDEYMPIRVYVTKVFDGRYPDTNKRIGYVSVDAKGTNLRIEYKIDDGDWTEIT